MNHLTTTQMQEYADGLSEGSGYESHVRSCAECRMNLKRFRDLEKTLRRIPLERVSSGFTEGLMKQLGVRESSSFAWAILKNLAPLLALTFVLGVLFAVLQLSGVFQGSQVQPSVEATQSAYVKLGGSVSAAIGAFNGWLEKYFSFAFAKSSYGLTVFLLLFLGAIALLDRFLLMPMMRRRT
jgi:anti-sigma factor RsiW